LLNAKGEVIGIASWTVIDKKGTTQNLNFAVASSEIPRVLKKAEEEGRVYYLRLGFSVEIPEKWETKTEAGRLFLLSPLESDKDPFRENVNVSARVLPQPITMEQYCAAVAAVLPKKLKNYKLHEKGDVTIDLVKAKKIVCSHRAGETEAKVVFYLLIKGKRACTLVGTARPATFDKYKGAFEKIAKSFRIESGKKEEPKKEEPKKVEPEKKPAAVRTSYKKKGFSIVFPAKWEKENAATAVTAMSPMETPTDAFRENVNVVVQDMGRTFPVEQYFKANLDALPKALTAFKLHEKGDATIGGAKAKWAVLSHTSGKVALKAFFCVVIKGNRAYTISCTSTPGAFAKYKDTFDGIAKSMKFE